MSLARVVPVIFLFAGCRLLDFDSCLYELRGVNVEGTLKEASADILYAYVGVDEQRDYQPNKYMVYRLTSALLKGHVTSATLRDAADESKSLFVFPLTGVNDNITSGSAVQSEGANLNGFFDVLANGRGMIDVRSDIPGREQVKFIPPVTSRQDWTRPKCG